MAKDDLQKEPEQNKESEANEELNRQAAEEGRPEEKQPEEGQQNESTDKIIEELQQKLAEKTKEAEDYYNRLLRTQADFDNYRRRTRQEREELIKFASEDLITELLPVLDNFDRALAAAESTDNEFVSGVQMIYRQLKEILAKEGLAEIPAVGEEFDPNKHEAVMQVESDEHEENIIVEELRKGYALKDKVIRPSMVKVAK